MIKQNKKMIILTSIVTLLPIVIGLLLWNQLPQLMATHFNFNGQTKLYSRNSYFVGIRWSRQLVSYTPFWWKMHGYWWYSSYCFITIYEFIYFLYFCFYSGAFANYLFVFIFSKEKCLKGVFWFCRKFKYFFFF